MKLAPRITCSVVRGAFYVRTEKVENEHCDALEARHSVGLLACKN